jgi:hypothetical protein
VIEDYHGLDMFDASGNAPCFFHRYQLWLEDGPKAGITSQDMPKPRTKKALSARMLIDISPDHPSIPGP